MSEPAGPDAPTERTASIPLLAAGDLRAGLVALVAMAVGGVVIGFVWAATAPHLDVPAVIGGSESAFSAQAGVDVYFALYGLVFGLVGGAVAWWRARNPGWPVPVGLAAGGLGGSLLAGWIGHGRRSHQVLAQLPRSANSLAVQLVDFQVRAHGYYLVYPFVAVGLFALLTWLTTRARRAGVPAAADGDDPWGPPPTEREAETEPEQQHDGRWSTPR